MSAPEDFLARWSRRKLDAGTDGGVPSDEGRLEPRTTEPELPASNEAALRAFDPASLPPIDSITAGTDIRPFLRSGVPAALTRSALRRAWMTDPAIRDFVGIAENQWNFNDPTAIPGFGLLRTDQMARLAENMFGGADVPIDRIAHACPPLSLKQPERHPVGDRRDGTAGDSDGQG